MGKLRHGLYPEGNREPQRRIEQETNMVNFADTKMSFTHTHQMIFGQQLTVLQLNLILHGDSVRSHRAQSHRSTPTLATNHKSLVHCW